MTSPTLGSVKRLPIRFDSTRWPISQRGDHRIPGDAIGLDQEGLDPERETECDGDDDDELEE